MELSSLSEYLFFHLHKTSPQTGLSCQGVNIPCTLFYRWAQPFFYYWKDSSDGKIRRFNKEKINLEKAKEDLLRGDCEIKARWLYEADKQVAQNEQILSVEYLDKHLTGNTMK